MPFPFPEPLCHHWQILRLVVGVKGKTLQSGPAVRHTDVQLRAKFYWLSRLAPHNGTQERLTDADDPVRNRVAAVVVHILLLLVKRADRREPGSFPFGKNPAQSELFFNGGKVSRQIA